ncbi:MAG: hypothetical protein ABIL58_23285 [Pseudomonadota bacterium]
MLIPAFNLPSNPAVEIRLQEATVQVMIDMADINPAREEAATTRFLDAISGADSRTWTADDRRFALLWYFVHVETDHSYQVRYECGHCGETHQFTFDLKLLLDGYRDILGKPEAKVTVCGKEVTIVPLDGRAMEALELERIGIEAMEAEHGVDSVEARKARLQMRLNELLHRIRFAGVENPDAHLTGMKIAELRALTDAVAAAEEKMTHGIESIYDEGIVYLVSPPHACPKGEETETRCRVRFRTGEFIPKL